MNRKLFLAILGIIIFAVAIPVARAQLTVTIDVKDLNGNSLKKATVDLNTDVKVYGYYKDNNGGLPATAKMEVYFNDGTGKKLEATLYSGYVSSGSTTIKPFKMTKMGTYEFKWDCTKQGSTTTASFSTLCRIEKGLDYTQIFTVPEPATIAGLLMALSAFGLFAVKRSKK
jgi:hypothetical protein